MKYIRTCTIKISLDEIKENPSRLEDFYPGLFITLKDGEKRDKDFLILELARYFYNTFTQELSLTLVVQDIRKTDIKNEKLIKNKQLLVTPNIKITKKIDEADVFDINDVNPGSYFYNKNDELIKMKEIYGFGYDKENNILFIYGLMNYVHGFGNKEIENKQKEIKRNNFKVHVQE